MPYHQVASRLVVATVLADTDRNVSQAVSMEGANAVMYELTAIAGTAGATVSAQLQVSNDLENWSSAGVNLGPLSVPSYSAKSSTAMIAARYVRLRYFVNNSGRKVVVAAGIHTAEL